MRGGEEGVGKRRSTPEVSCSNEIDHPLGRFIAKNRDRVGHLGLRGKSSFAHGLSFGQRFVTGWLSE